MLAIHNQVARGGKRPGSPKKEGPNIGSAFSLKRAIFSQYGFFLVKQARVKKRLILFNKIIEGFIIQKGVSPKSLNRSVFPRYGCSQYGLDACLVDVLTFLSDVVGKVFAPLHDGETVLKLEHPRSSSSWFIGWVCPPPNTPTL